MPSLSFNRTRSATCLRAPVDSAAGPTYSSASPAEFRAATRLESSNQIRDRGAHMSMYSLYRYARTVAATTITLALALTACQPSAPAPASANASAADAARAASVTWDEAHNAADLTRLMQLYSDSAVSMPYNRPALEGRSAIEADFRDFFGGFNADHKTTIVSLEVAGDWAIERGKYELSATPKAGGPTVNELGKHIVVRRKVDGAWKIQWEIWNTDAAPSSQ